MNIPLIRLVPVIPMSQVTPIVPGPVPRRAREPRPAFSYACTEPGYVRRRHRTRNTGQQTRARKT